MSVKIYTYRILSHAFACSSDVLHTQTHTCVLVESEESRGSSRYSAVGHPAIFPRIRVICCYLDDGGSRGTMGAEANCVEDWIEGGPVIIDVYHGDPYTGY